MSNKYKLLTRKNIPVNNQVTKPKAPLLFEMEMVENVMPAVTRYMAELGNAPETKVFSYLRFKRIFYTKYLPLA